MNFTTWLKTLIEEKGIDTGTILNVKSKNGTPNAIPVGCVMEAMNRAPRHEQQAIKTTLVKIDYVNGDVLHFFKHLAKAIAVDF